MRPRDLGIVAFALILIGVLVYAWIVPSGYNQAPTVSFNTLKGEHVRLATLRGKPIFLTFWATSCVGCMKEMPHLIDLHNELNKKGLEIIGVAMDYDPPGQVLETVRRRNVPYTITLDSDGSIAKAFGGVRLTPTSYLIDPNGRVVLKKLGEVDIEKLRRDILDMIGSEADLATLES